MHNIIHKHKRAYTHIHDSETQLTPSGGPDVLSAVAFMSVMTDAGTRADVLFFLFLALLLPSVYSVFVVVFFFCSAN